MNIEQREKYSGNIIQVDLNEGKELIVYKYAAVLSSRETPFKRQNGGGVQRTS